MRLSHDRPGLTMAAVGAAAVVAGGLVAAVTGPLALARGSWAAAYLVLVCGVGQVAMAAARLVTPERLVTQERAPAPGRATGASGSERLGWQQLLTWNLANALVVTGTLARVPWLVDLGGLGCVAALALAWRQSRTLPQGVTIRAYRAILALLAVSIPVGLVLTHFRNAR